MPCGVYQRTEETLAKMSASRKRIPVTAETRVKLSEANHRRRLSPETCAKIAAAMKGKSPTAETRAKMSVSRKGMVQTVETCAKRGAKLWKGGRKISGRKQKAKRRQLGFVPLNSLLPGYEGHHTDKEHVIYIPEKLHQSIRHNVWSGENMAKINTIAYDFLSKQEVETTI